jgi:hypothetical protein
VPAHYDLAMAQKQSIFWQFFPVSDPPPRHLVELVQQFELKREDISSESHDLPSDKVVEVLRPGLLGVGYSVEMSKAAADKISVPVLFGRNGRVTKAFDADAYQADTRTVLEVEAGRGYTNYQFLKDLFQACMIRRSPEATSRQAAVREAPRPPEPRCPATCSCWEG